MQMKGDLVTVNSSPERVRQAEHPGITEFAGEWVNRLKQIEVELDMITDQAEDEFLSLGRMFGDFHRRARMISETSADVAGKMTGLKLLGRLTA